MFIAIATQKCCKSNNLSWEKCPHVLVCQPHNPPNNVGENPVDHDPKKPPKQEKNTLCSFCDVYGNYTHHFPHLFKALYLQNEAN